MVEHKANLYNTLVEDEETYTLLSHVHNNPDVTQRQLSSSMDISLGKTNYLLKELIKKGIIKVCNFSHKQGKVRKASYMLTPTGIKAVAKLTYHFLKRKEKEYNRLKKEWQRLQSKGG